MTGLLLSLLLNASTAVAGPYADLEQAGWSLEAGHAETALARALAIADAHPALHDAASLLAARAEIALGRADDARVRLRALLRDAPADPDLVWTLARLEVGAGRPARGRALLRPLLRVDDPAVHEPAAIARDAWRAAARPTPRRHAALGNALDTVRDAHSAIHGEGRAARIGIAVTLADRIPLRTRPGALRRRLAWMQRADADAERLVEERTSRATFDGLVAAARGWRNLGDALDDAPTPRRLTAEQGEIYRASLDKPIRRAWARARDAAEAALRVAERFRLPPENPDVADARATRDALDARLARPPAPQQ